jgi:putative flippase GtrA
MVRYSVIGVLNNLVGYMIYLLITWRWLDPKVAVTLLYPIGALIGYYGNSKFAFSYSGSHQTGLMRYVTAHVMGYMLNILILFVFVDLLAYGHFLIQAIAICAVAGVLFVLFRYYVFPSRDLT